MFGRRSSRNAARRRAKQQRMYGTASPRGIRSAISKLRQRKSTTPTAQQKKLADARKASRTTTRRPKMTPAQIAAIRKRQKAALDARRRKVRRPTEAQRKAANDARRRPTRNTRTPNIDDLIAAAKRKSGRTGSGTLEAKTKAAKDMNRIQRQMRGMRPSGRPVGQPIGRRRRPVRTRRR